MSKIIIGIMGPGKSPHEKDLQNAFELGRRLAQQGFVVMTGGSKLGVMNAALKGAKAGGGLTIGILASHEKNTASEHADIIIPTGMLSARNNINVLTSDVMIACGLEAGTLSEIAMGIKAGKKVVLICGNALGNEFLLQLGRGQVIIAENVEDVLAHVKILLQEIQGAV